MRLAEWPRDPYLNEELREWVQLHLEALGVADVAVFAAVVGREEDERRVVVATEVGLLDSWYAPRGSSARYGLSVRLYPWQAVHGVDLRGETSRVWAYEHESRWRLRVARPALDLLAETPELGRALAQFAAACAVMAEPAGADDASHPADTSVSRAFAAPPDLRPMPTPPPRIEAPSGERRSQAPGAAAPVPPPFETSAVEMPPPAEPTLPRPTPPDTWQPGPAVPPIDAAPQLIAEATDERRAPGEQQPMAAAEQPIEPTAQPIEPTEQPMAAAERPIEPTEQPIEPTEQPMAAAEQPMAAALPAYDEPVNDGTASPREADPRPWLSVSQPVQEPRASAWQQLIDEPPSILREPDSQDEAWPDAGYSQPIQQPPVESETSQPAAASEDQQPAAEPAVEAPAEPVGLPGVDATEPRPSDRWQAPRSPFQRRRPYEPVPPALPEPALSFEEQYPGEEVLFGINPLPAEPPPARMMTPPPRSEGAEGPSSGNGATRPLPPDAAGEGRHGPFPRQVVDRAALPSDQSGQPRPARFPGQIFRVGGNAQEGDTPQRTPIRVEAESTAEIILDLERRLGLRPRR